jgi:two-component system cell cycle sensor histidine kinase/response regulator CckA
LLEGVRTNLLDEPNIRGIVNNYRDVTDQRRTEEQVRLLTLAVEQGPAAVLMTDRSGNIEYVNRKFTEDIGYTLEEARGKNARILASGLTPVTEYEHLWKTIVSGSVYRGEMQNRRKDGSLFWSDLHLSPVRDDAGEITHFMGVQTDISGRKLADAALEESLGRFRGLIDATFDAISIAQDGIIREVNKGFLQTFGVERAEDAVGRSVLDFVAEESRAEVARRVELNVEGADEIVGKRADGRKILLETTSKAHTMDGRPARITAVRDVTGARALQQQFLQAQKMEAVGQLAGGVAHDFNNLLTVIKSYGAFLLEDSLVDGDRRESVEQIVAAADRAATLTRQLLAFSRRQLLDPKVLNLNAVVTDIEKMLRRVVTERIAFRMALREPLGTVLADAGQIEQVIVNLAVNARDAMPSGGEIIVSTANVEVSGEGAAAKPGQRPGKWVTITVSDTGTGIDEATRARMFEPFFTTKERGLGTGLGLSTTLGIVEQSGGYVRVESEVGRGSTFEVYLPHLDVAAEQRGGEETGPNLVRGTERVLVVEDEASVRLLVTKVLASFGYTVLEARDGREALSLALKLDVPPDLVVTDVVMPRMSGREMVAALRERWPAIRVLFMSGYSEDAVADPAVLASNAVFIAKPFRPKQLARKVREALDEARNPAS